MTLDFGHALAVSFPLSRYIPQENVHAVNTVTFSPQATHYRNRYGVLPVFVKGWPDGQLQHGQSTFWLGPLLAHPAFLAAHPEWAGVTVSEPLSVSDYTDLCFAASATLGGAYTWLRDQADMLGLLGSASGSGPVSSPGAPGVPGVAGPGSKPTPTLTPPAPVPVSNVTVVDDRNDPGLTPAIRLSIATILKAAYPSKSVDINAANALLGNGTPTPVKLIKTLLPVIVGTDSKTAAWAELLSAVLSLIDG